MIAKIKLEEFRKQINNFRQTNDFKISNSTTDFDKVYYTALGLGFEMAISLFINCAEYAADDEVDDEQITKID